MLTPADKLDPEKPSDSGAPRMNTSRLKEYKKTCDEMFALQVKAFKNPHDQAIDSKKRELGMKGLGLLMSSSGEETEAMKAYSNYLDEKLEKMSIPTVFNLP